MMIPADPISSKALMIPVLKPRGILPSLAVGEILEGRAIENLADNKVLVSLKNTWVVAETKNTFLPGENFIVQVKQLSPKVMLSLLPEPTLLSNKLISQIRSLLPHQITLGRLIGDLQENIIFNEQFEWDGKEKLQSILSSLIFNQTPEGFLKTFIYASGLLYENKILRYLCGANKEPPQDDLKGLLLKLIGELRNGAALKAEGASNLSLTNLVLSGVKNIELQQYLNLLAKDTGDFYLLQIPVSFSEKLETVDLYLYNQCDKSREKEKEESYTLVFLLDLERLGRIKIVTFVAKMKILCRFIVTQDDLAEFVQFLLPQLRERLENLGYQVEALSCTAAKDASDQVEKPEFDLDDILERISSLNLWV